MTNMGKSWLIAGIFVIILLLVGIGTAATTSLVKPETKVTPLYKVRVYRSTDEKKFDINTKFLKGDRLLVLSALRYRLESLKVYYNPAFRTQMPTLICPCKTSGECLSFIVKCVTVFTCITPSCR